MSLSDAEVAKYRDAFRAISSRKEAPESVQTRNAVMADLLQELLDLRSRIAQAVRLIDVQATR